MTRVFASNYRDKKRDYPDPFPVHTLKRVDRPTTLIHDDQVQRVDERDGGFQRAGRNNPLHNHRAEPEIEGFIKRPFRAGAHVAGAFPVARDALREAGRIGFVVEFGFFR